jgi:hypothetical protein
MDGDFFLFSLGCFSFLSFALCKEDFFFLRFCCWWAGSYCVSSWVCSLSRRLSCVIFTMINSQPDRRHSDQNFFSLTCALFQMTGDTTKSRVVLDEVEVRMEGY